MSVVRPLPARPSLEFERKEAKALLRRLRAGDPASLARVRAQHAARPPNAYRLTNAQLTIAREYGFASWPRLVRYFGDVERQRYVRRRPHSLMFHENEARSLLVEHEQRRIWTWRALSLYIPRLYGLRPDEVFATTITEDEAKLAVARMYSVPSWEALLERIAEKNRLTASASGPGPDEESPWARARRAIQTLDLRALERVVEAHPELIRNVDHEDIRMSSLFRSALEQERQRGVDALRPIVEWLGRQGFDLQHELTIQLCARFGQPMKTDHVQWLLDRGADPSWVAPNGHTVLEHALARYWNGDAVDLVAARTRPRRTFWIAAGLGQVDLVRRFLDGNGKPTADAYRLRPEVNVLFNGLMLQHPEPDDEEILVEAFLVAMLNGRANVMEYMASRGFPVNTLTYGSPLIHVAIGNVMRPAVESLIRCGADLDLRGWRPNQSAREVARWRFEGDSNNPELRRIAELCGLDPDGIVAERDARAPRPPGFSMSVHEALEFAQDDAYRLGHPNVRPHHLLFGILRTDSQTRSYFTQSSRMDADRFNHDMEDRLAPGADRVARATLSLDEASNAVIDAAVAAATERKREVVSSFDLAYALLESPMSGVADLLARYGGVVSLVQRELDRAMR